MITVLLASLVVGSLLTPVVVAGVGSPANVERTQASVTLEGSSVEPTSVSASESGAESEPETADEFLLAFNDLRGTEAFATYSEFELVRSQAVVGLQSNSFSDANREQLSHLLAALTAFERAYESAASDDAVASVDDATEVDHHLEELEAAGGDEYARLGSVALSRFYEQQGDELYEHAQTVATTPDRLEVLEAAVTAYERSGNTGRYAAIQVEHDGLEATYERDLERYDEAMAGSAAFLEDCHSSCGGVTDVLGSTPSGAFDAYVGAQQAHADATVAMELADQHALEEVTEETTATRQEAFEAMVTTGIASSVVVAVYLFVMITVSSLVVWRLRAWKHDVVAARVDDVVVERGGFDA